MSSSEFVRLLLSRTYYIVALLATILVLGSYVLISLNSLWIGNTDILIPIKVSFVLIIMLYVGYSVMIAVTSIIRKDLNKALFSFIAMGFLIFSVARFLDVLSEFVFGREAFINLTVLPTDVRLLSTIGLLLPIVFIGYSIYYFVVTMALFSFVAKFFEAILKAKSK